MPICSVAPSSTKCSAIHLPMAASASPFLSAGGELYSGVSWR